MRWPFKRKQEAGATHTVTYLDDWDRALHETPQSDHRKSFYIGDKADTEVEVVTVLPTPHVGYEWQAEVTSAWKTSDWVARNCQPHVVTWTLVEVAKKVDQNVLVFCVPCDRPTYHYTFTDGERLCANTHEAAE